MKKFILYLVICAPTLFAQQAVNNYTVKTNLILRGQNVSSQLSPVAPILSTNWLNIATWGDSLTAGTGASPSSNAYPATLGLLSGFTVSNGGVGGETSAQVKTRMVADTNSYPLPTIIWVGRNDVYTNSPANIVSNINLMISALANGANSNRWLVMNVLNGEYVPYDAIGGVGYMAITNLNAQLSATYGTRYVPIREALVAAYNPALTNDVYDYNLDIPPASLRSDQVHLNNAGYAAVANYIYTNYFAILRTDWSQFTSPVRVQQILAAPYPIGITTPNTGVFSDLYSTFVRVGSPSAFKFLSLSGDSSSIQANGKFIPISHNTYDLGFSSSLAWKDLWLNGYAYTGGLLTGQGLITNLSRVETLTGTGNITLTNSGNTARLQIDNDYRGYKYNDNSGAGYGAAANISLLTIGTYNKMMSGVLTVRTWSASSRGFYTYVLSVGGGGATATITPTSFQQYGATPLTGVLTLVQDTPVAGTDTVRFTVGANALTAIEYMWKPFWVDSGSAITGF